MTVRLHSDADLGENELTVVSAHGSEAVSGLFEYTAEVEASAPGGLDDDAIDELLNRPVALEVPVSGTRIHGIVKHIHVTSMLEDTPPRYELTIAPRLSRLALTHRSRVVAQDEDHLTIIKGILDDHSIAYDDQCQVTYPAREYTVQYDESDLALALRLMQFNGIHFHFQHGDQEEVVILGDGNDAFEPPADAEQLRYQPTSGRTGENAPVVTALDRNRAPVTSKVVLREYNWRTPHQALRAEVDADTRTGVGTLDLFGEHWADDDEGRRLAEVRAQAALVKGDVFSGTTYLASLRAGMWFELTDHPNPDYNRRYVVLETSGDLGSDPERHFMAIPFDRVVRPERTVPWPRLQGIVHALVDGESRSTTTPVDDQGRYRLVLPLDAGGQAGGRATRWVRRAQPYAGEAYGMHFPLHIGMEVAVGHVNGDPDRPLILGAVPNAATTSPVTSGNATAAVIRTGSGIVMEFEDDA